MRLSALALVAVTGWPLGAMATDLNAAVAEHPTIGSEILHGSHAAFACFRQALMDATAFGDCINNAALAAEAREADASAFKVGLFYTAWQLPSGAPGFEAVRADAHASLLPLQRRVGVTDAQSAEAAQMTPP